MCLKAALVACIALIGGSLADDTIANTYYPATTNDNSEPLAKSSDGWVEDTSFIYNDAGNAGNFYPTQPNHFQNTNTAVGFGLSDIITTGLMIAVGMFMLTFTFTLLRNIFASDFISDLISREGARAIDAETVQDVIMKIQKAYEAYNDLQ